VRTGGSLPGGKDASGSVRYPGPMTRRFALVAALLALAPLRASGAAPRVEWTPERALTIAAATGRVAIPASPDRNWSLDDSLTILGAPGAALPAELTSIQQDAIASVLSAVSDAAITRSLVFAPYRDVIDDVIADPTLAPVLLAGIDRGSLLRAQLDLVRAARAARPTLATISLAEATCIGSALLCIGTDGDDEYAFDAQILIDPAGDDLYANNGGGTLQTSVFAATGGCVLGGGSTGRARPNLSCSPAPSTVCTYDVANRATERDDLPVLGVPGHDDPATGGDGADGSCGSDVRRDAMLAGIANLFSDDDARAVTLLLDLDGADTYTWHWHHDDHLFGLVDACYPNEPERRNTNRDFIQGSALAGLALTWDSGTGDDIFRGRLNAQGSGHVGGVGMLAVDGDGDTTFWADRLSQGNGIAAGIGLLVDTATGAQRFLLDPPIVYRNEFAPNARDCQQEGRAGQAEGGFGGVGVLVAAGGSSAHYRAVTHVTSNAYPYDPVLDGRGAPMLVPGTDAQGSGESFPISATAGGVVIGGGILIDATDGDARVCPNAGMLTGSSTGLGISLTSIGVIDPSCGKFNVPAEIGTDLGEALQRLSAGALGVRVVLP